MATESTNDRIRQIAERITESFRALALTSEVAARALSAMRDSMSASIDAEQLDVALNGVANRPDDDAIVVVDHPRAIIVRKQG